MLFVESPATAPEPVPLREIVCGEPVALSARLTVAVSVPTPEGLNVTVMTHVALIAKLIVQVLVWVNELLPARDTAGLFQVSAAVPELVTVIFCVAAAAPTAVLAKVRVDADRPTAGAATAPVPEMLIVCGELAALSATVSVAES